ncbi:EamA-like transporter family protein [Nostoc calcicola FACHB-389]|nr:EamA family transporter [Nostoc calcicola FACHB-3891]OKH21037.1 EamA-like transporter family protein [Nostoc calcicola FACHB-389]
MSTKEFGIFLISIFCNIVGQILLKSGALKLGEVNATNLFNHIIRILFTPELIIGLSCYAIGAIAYILVLTRVNLSVVGPSTALVYVCSFLIGYFFFHETISLNRTIGLGLIVCGVILVISR